MQVLRRYRAIAGFVGAMAFLPSSPGIADAATRYEVTRTVPKAGGGVYLQNTVSGYYMGRLFADEHFT